jgi:hypothetical protein
MTQPEVQKDVGSLGWADMNDAAPTICDAFRQSRSAKPNPLISFTAKTSVEGELRGSGRPRALCALPRS